MGVIVFERNSLSNSSSSAFRHWAFSSPRIALAYVRCDQSGTRFSEHVVAAALTVVLLRVRGGTGLVLVLEGIFGKGTNCIAGGGLC